MTSAVAKSAPTKEGARSPRERQGKRGMKKIQHKRPVLLCKPPPRLPLGNKCGGPSAPFRAHRCDKSAKTRSRLTPPAWSPPPPPDQRLAHQVSPGVRAPTSLGFGPRMRLTNRWSQETRLPGNIAQNALTRFQAAFGHLRLHRTPPGNAARREAQGTARSTPGRCGNSGSVEKTALGCTSPYPCGKKVSATSAKQR